MIARAALILALGMLPAAALAWTKPPPDDACRPAPFEGGTFTLCQAVPGKQTLRLVDRGPNGKPLRSFAKLKAAGGKAPVAFAMNAGMFDAGGAPVGLYVEGGAEKHAINRRNGPGNFHMQPNGVFAVDAAGRVAIVPSTAWPPPRFDVRWATQSGPMLVIAGQLHPLIQPNGESRYIRNAVGVADPRTAWFVISDDPVSFGRLARFLRDRLGCRDALYFDGAVSSLWDPAHGRQDSREDLGPLVAVLRKPAR